MGSLHKHSTWSQQLLKHVQTVMRRCKRLHNTPIKIIGIINWTNSANGPPAQIKGPNHYLQQVRLKRSESWAESYFECMVACSIEQVQAPVLQDSHESALAQHFIMTTFGMYSD